jgi:hypothetical protein
MIPLYRVSESNTKPPFEVSIAHFLSLSFPSASHCACFASSLDLISPARRIGVAARGIDTMMLTCRC